MSSTAAPAKRAAKKATATVAAPSATPVAAPAVAAPAVVVAPVSAHVNSISHVETASAASATEDVNIVAQFNQLVEQVNTLRSTLGSVFSNMKKLEKQIPRELKRASKGRRARKAAADADPSTPKKETVFTKPTAISDALCTFLSIPKGTLLSRSEVTTRVCRYAKEKSLMVKQVIKADAPLRKLLALTEADELKILNLQRYLKPHYLKPATPSTA
jgi:chromatin remodeling complex protein RSC6